MEQLLLIPEEKKPPRIIEYSEIEYERLDLLNKFRNDGTRIVTYQNHVGCRGYGQEDNKYIIFETEKQRNNYMEDLNKYYGTDKHGNNSFGYTQLGIYIDEKQIEDYFGDIFLYCIIFLGNDCEKTGQNKKKNIINIQD